MVAVTLAATLPPPWLLQMGTRAGTRKGQKGKGKTLMVKGAYLGKETGQQSIRGDVERNSQAQITGALVHLTAQLTIRHIELSPTPTQGQRDLHLQHCVPGPAL